MATSTAFEVDTDAERFAGMLEGKTSAHLALARWIREYRPDLKVILASGVVSTLDPADAAFHEGPLLQKLFKVEELKQRLRSALGDAPGSECT